jgi:hypothetical protein
MGCDKKTSIRKFSLAEMTSNETGKTSGSGAMGCLCVSIGCLGFIYGSYDYAKGSGTNEIISQSMMLVMTGASLLGIRKVGASFGRAESPPPTKQPTDESEEASSQV